jgi:uncharacterized membrane protein/protein-S-isoprenylcysteine O-methyltransferase Ste14
MVVVSFPIIYIGYYPQNETTYWDFLGSIFAVLGIMIESVADKQLIDFKNKSSKEDILDQGLWSLCRHPNYLGEILFWWGIFFFSISVNNSFITIISPILITFLLTKVSGSPMLEKLLEKKGESFKIYLNKVPRSIIPCSLKDILTFLVLVFFLLVLDGLWLGYLLKDFYIEETREVALISQGSWKPVLWAVYGVYFFIPFGLFIFSIKKSTSATNSFLYGSIFGLITYSIYEFTNIALLKNWPLDMALVDIIWGPILCGLSCLFTKIVIDNFKKKF